MIQKLFIFLLLIPITLKAQKISGKIYNDQKETLADVKVKIQGTKIFVLSNEYGQYEINLKPGNYIVSFSSLGFLSSNVEVKLIAGKDFPLSITLQRDLQALEQVIVQDQVARNEGMIKIDPKILSSNPNVSQNFESILKQLPGVSTNNELSSQYSVRGGNFDENLIYINDVEIYKPYLVRNGQQEGLSLINPDLVGNVKFSAGGFAAKYGDKLSSVLDVGYKTSDSSKVILGVGTNGTSLTTFFGGKKFSYSLAYRNKKNTSVLNSQPVVGSYNPKFNDFQGLFNWKINDKTSLSFLGIYNANEFGLIPQSRVTEFGTFNEVLRLSVNYQGQERDEYKDLMGAVTLRKDFNKNTTLKWINSAFFITERENFDILGQYVFDEVDNDFTSNNFGKVKANRGIGAFQNYGRNQLNADIYASDLKLNFNTKKSYWETGIRFQYDKIADQLKEFKLIDSAGYTIPNTYQDFKLTESYEAANAVNTLRYSAYAQNTTDINERISFTGGVRFNYNDFTKEFLVSPRAIVTFHPDFKKDIIYRFATGIYSQPPFYREERNFDGTLNRDIKSQKSVHLALSMDDNFKGLGTTLKFTAEAYYKYLYHLTPYDIENLKIRYYANQQSKGYATGLDLRINGEFVKDLESSFRLSIMKTAEDIDGDSYIQKDDQGNTTTIYPRYIKRPTDQRLNFSAFFQDKLFNSPTYKVHLNLLYGSRLPIGPPGVERYQQTFHIPAYKRLDIGFSKDFLDPESTHQPKLLKKFCKSFIVYAEVFNVLNINNTVSYLWITDVNNFQFAIPNYLTSRQLNLRLISKF